MAGFLRFKQCFYEIATMDVKIGFLGKRVISFGKLVLNRLSVLLTFIKNIVLYKANNIIHCNLRTHSGKWTPNFES